MQYLIAEPASQTSAKQTKEIHLLLTGGGRGTSCFQDTRESMEDAITTQGRSPFWLLARVIDLEITNWQGNIPTESSGVADVAWSK